MDVTRRMGLVADVSVGVSSCRARYMRPLLLLICARQIGISDRRWMVFWVVEISYAQCNHKRQGGISVGRYCRPMMKNAFSPVVC